jgi:phytanoyl-CoA hydroxylase
MRFIERLRKQFSGRSAGGKVLIEDDLPWFDRKGAYERIACQVKDSVQRARITELIEQGFTVIERGVDVELCDKAAGDFLSWRTKHKEALARFREPDGRLMRVINLHQTLPILKALFSRNSSLALQDYLFENETVLYTSLFYEQGSAQPIHRDTPLFWTYPANMYFGMWIALEDTDDGNGALTVIPGGHRIGSIDRGGMAAKRFNDLTAIPDMSSELWTDYQDEVVKRADAKQLKKKKIYVKKGDVILWHPLAPHGGAAIKDPTRTRLSMVVHTTPKGVPVFHMDVFFNPSRRVRRDAPWSYAGFEGRSIAETGPMSIGHGIEYDFTSLT